MMNRQQVEQQTDFVRRELTRVTQEMLYLEGSQLQTLRVRQSRLAAELERLQALQFSGSYSSVVLTVKDVPFHSSFLG